MADRAALEENVDRLGDYARRLHETVARATSLHTTFDTLNTALVSDQYNVIGPLAGTLNCIQTSLLREMVLIVTRVLDKPRHLQSNNRVSFEVVRQWLREDGVREAIIENARTRHKSRFSRRNVILTMRRLHLLDRSLLRLAIETPNRERLLRNFRDDFLAHELQHEIPRDLPEFGHLMTMITEIQRLASHCTFICTGYELGFDHLEVEAKDGAEQLWRAVSERNFEWHPKVGLVEK